MIYDGVVIRIDKLYLFILNPETNKIMDGINISEHECYKDMREDQLMVVKVEFKDGTLTIDNIDLDEFIHGDSYGSTDIFIYIKDVELFTIYKKTKKRVLTLKELIDKGNLNEIAFDCIKNSKNNK